MSNTKLPLFVQEIVALIKGDDAEATAIKIQRQATNALTPQISVKESLTFDLEEKVVEAKENLKQIIRNSGKLIEDRESYIRKLLEAKERIEEAEDNLEDHLSDIDFLKECLEEVKK